MDPSDTPQAAMAVDTRNKPHHRGLITACAVAIAATLLFGLHTGQPEAATIGLSDGSLIQGQLTSAINGDCIVTRPSGATVSLRCAEISSLQSQGERAPDAGVPMTSAVPALRIAGSNTIGARLMPALMVEFARSRGAIGAKTSIKGPEQVLIEFTAPSQFPWRQVEIASHGTASGFKGLVLPANATTPVAAAPVAAALAPVSPASQPGIANAPEEQIMTASTSVAELWRDIDAGPQARVGETPGTTAPSQSAAPTPTAAGKTSPPADLAMASRRINSIEVHALRELGSLDHPLNEHVIALDGLAVIVNRSNRIESLSIDEIGKVFAGAINDWSEIGGAPGPIRRYARTEGSGTMDTFASLVLHGAPLATDIRRIEDSRELAAEVAQHPGAIGFVGMPYVGASKALGIRECGLSYQPTSFNTKTEEYPLSRRLYLYAPARRAAGLQDFLQFTATPTAQRVVDANGFVDLSVETDAGGDQRRLRLSAGADAAPRRHEESVYANMLKSANRLSVTLRFRSAAADLDTRAVRDIERIHAFVKDNAGRRLKLTLAGFSDAIGSPEANKALSLSRAYAVAAMLKGLPVARVLGLGPEFPVACNTSDEGRSKNRRVEIWIEG